MSEQSAGDRDHQLDRSGKWEIMKVIVLVWLVMTVLLPLVELLAWVRRSIHRVF